MTRSITITTPENIEVTYQLAGFVSRFAALLTDLLLQIALLMVIDTVVALVTGVVSRSGLSFSSVISAGGYLATFIVLFGYATACEMAWAGRTPGKKLFGLRVVRDGGLAIDLMSSALRNIMRFVDFGILPIPGAPLVLFGLPGIVSIICSPEYKRLGDYAAGTLVIVERTESHASARSVHAKMTLPPNVNAALQQLSDEDYTLVRKFVARADALEPSLRDLMAANIAEGLFRRIALPLPRMTESQRLEVLTAIERCCAEQRGLL